MSTSSQRTVGLRSPSGSPRSSPDGWVMSWMQSKVVTRSSESSVGQRRQPRILERHVRQSAFGEPFLGPLEGEPGDVVAGERGGGERFGHQQHGASGAATDVGDLRTPARAGRRPRRAPAAPTGAGTPGSTARSCARCRPRPRVRGCRSRVRARSGSSRACARALASSGAGDGTCPSRRPGWSGEASTAAASGPSENRSASSALDQLGARLVVGPFADPALVEAEPAGELRRRQRVTRLRPAPGRARAGRRGGSCPR